MVGLIPLFAVQIWSRKLLDRMPGFKRRLQWFIENRKDLTSNHGLHGRPRRRRSAAVFHHWCANSCDAYCKSCWMKMSFSRRMAFARSLAIHKEHPYMLDVDGTVITSVTMSPANRPPDFLAAIPTGAGRSGFP